MRTGKITLLLKKGISWLLVCCLFSQTAIAEVGVATSTHPAHPPSYHKDASSRSQIDANINPAQASVSMDSAANGVQVVQINAPNGAGISHNRFNDFNVSESGLILNNNPNEGISELGGMVLANPNMVSGSGARTIINEVISNHASDIRGATEIFGQKANYILANPNGINVGNAYFINMNGVTLTTGNLQFNSLGELEKILVDKGHISFSKDLNLRNLDYFDVIARTTRIGAELHAGREARIVTGVGEFNTKSKQFNSNDASEAAPSIAIDSYHLGGLYAGKIFIQANEKGAGVNLGKAIATSGEIVIDANGDLRHRDINSSSNINIKSSANIVADQESKIEAKGNISYVAAGDIEFRSKNIQSHGSLGISVQGQNFINYAAIATSVGGIKIETRGNLFNSGSIVARGNIQAKAGGAFENVSFIHSKFGQINFTSSRDMNNEGVITTGQGGILLVSKSNFANAGIISANSTLIIDIFGNVWNIPDHASKKHGILESKTSDVIIRSVAGLVDNRGTLHAKRKVKLTSKTNLVNTGQIQSELVEIDSEGNIEINGKVKAREASFKSDSNIILGGDIHSSDKLSVIALGDIENNGRLYNSRRIYLDASGNIANLGLVFALDNLQITASGHLVNRGDIKSRNYLYLSSGQNIQNSGEISSQGRAHLKTLGEFRNEGEITSSEHLFIESKRSATNIGTIEAAKVLNIFSGLDIANPGKLLSGGKEVLVVTGGNILNMGGIGIEYPTIASTPIPSSLSPPVLPESGGYLHIRAARNFTNSGTATSKKTEKVVLRAFDINNDGGILLAASELDLEAQRDLANLGGIVRAKSIKAIAARDFTGTKAANLGPRLADAGTIASEEAMTITIGDNFSHSGNIEAGGALVIDTDVFDNSDGEIFAHNDATLITSGDILNSRGKFTGKGKIEIRSISGDIDNEEGLIFADGPLDISSLGGLSSKKGHIESSHGTVVIATENFDNIEGKLLSGDDLQVVTERDITNQFGVIRSGKNLP